MDQATIAQFLESYRGRDKVYRLISYLSQFVAGGLKTLGHEQSASRLESLGSALSSCRVVLRLSDDLAMWQVTKAFGLGSQERHPVLRILGIIQNVFDQLYYPLEHVAWACDSGLLKRPSALWWVASVAAWAGSLLTSVVTTFVKLKQLNSAIAQARRTSFPTSAVPVVEVSEDSEEEDNDEQQPHKRRQQQPQQQRRRVPMTVYPSLEAQRKQLLLELVQNVADVINAIHWMPPGFLWGTKLSSIVVGFNGAVSSLIGLYLMLQRYREQHAEQHRSNN